MAELGRRERLRRRLAAAQGREPCDVIVEGVRYLDVFSCEMVDGDVAIKDGVIVGTEPGLRAARTIDGRDKWLVPGFIDAHVHLESSLLVPESFQEVVLPRGTTSAVCDPHELANVLGVPGIEYFLDASRRLSLDLYVMLSSCVPATTFETNGGGTISADALAPLRAHEAALGLAEVMNVPGVLAGDDAVVDKLLAFGDAPMDGHAPLVRGRELSAYAATGVSSCHESSELYEAREKVRKGMSVWIREGSVAKDLDALAPLLTLATSTSVGFCTDDRNPLDIAEEGHIDHLVRKAIARGAPAEVAYRAASWSVARHYGLAGPGLPRRGSSAVKMARVGAVAPGFVADLVLLDDLETCAIREVLKGGALASEIPAPRRETAAKTNTIRATAPSAEDLEGPTGRVHVIGVKPRKILTDRAVMDADAKGVRRLSVLERYGHGSRPANGYVTGFGDLEGAIASSVGHDSHNLIVVGRETSDMRAALAALIEVGGGFAVVRGGALVSRLALPIGGLMTDEPPERIAEALRHLRRACVEIGCVLEEPFLQLAFLSLPVIPRLKLTDRGLMDVDAFRLIDVRAA